MKAADPSKHYLGKPCPRPGHGRERFISDHGCVRCAYERVVRSRRARASALLNKRCGHQSMNRLPKLATTDDAAKLVDLLCSAPCKVGLREHVCRPENRPTLLNWMKGECDAQRVWTLTDGSTLRGMLILKESLSGILYVVVAERFRGRGVGPALVRHVQSLGLGHSMRRHVTITRGECLSAAVSVRQAIPRLQVIQYCCGNVECSTQSTGGPRISALT
jgi:hypothetical protein